MAIAMQTGKMENTLFHAIFIQSMNVACVINLYKMYMNANVLLLKLILLLSSLKTKFPFGTDFGK